jgi:hypothetical protein
MPGCAVLVALTLKLQQARIGVLSSDAFRQFLRFHRKRSGWPSYKMCTIAKGVHMRTNVVIDDKLMADALKACGARTKREAVELGLKTLLQIGRQAEVRRLKGKVNWEGDLEAMRRDK